MPCPHALALCPCALPSHPGCKALHPDCPGCKVLCPDHPGFKALCPALMPCPCTLVPWAQGLAPWLPWVQGLAPWLPWVQGLAPWLPWVQGLVPCRHTLPLQARTLGTRSCALTTLVILGYQLLPLATSKLMGDNKEFNDSAIFWGALLIVGVGKLQIIEDLSLVTNCCP